MTAEICQIQISKFYILEKNHKKQMKNIKQWNTNIQEMNIKQCNYVK